eukprot:1161540-Pelagomonas_calceolata.AAC.17
MEGAYIRKPPVVGPQISPSGRDVPVFLERSVIDFRCVMVDHTYREKLVVRNGANTAMKVSVPNRPDVRLPCSFLSAMPSSPSSQQSVDLCLRCLEAFSIPFLLNLIKIPLQTSSNSLLKLVCADRGGIPGTILFKPYQALVKAGQISDWELSVQAGEAFSIAGGGDVSNYHLVQTSDFHPHSMRTLPGRGRRRWIRTQRCASMPQKHSFEGEDQGWAASSQAGFFSHRETKEANMQPALRWLRLLNIWAARLISFTSAQLDYKDQPNQCAGLALPVLSLISRINLTRSALLVLRLISRTSFIQCAKLALLVLSLIPRISFTSAQPDLKDQLYQFAGSALPCSA